MSFPRYPKYKESGVPWLGEVPAHWEVKRLRFVAELNPSKSEIANLDGGTNVSFLPMEAIGDDGTLITNREKPIAELEQGYTYFRDGDVVVAKITPCFENGKGALMRGLLNGVGFGTTELIVARPRAGEVTGEYLHHLFTSREFRALGESYMYGAGGQKRVPDAFVRDFATAFPPSAEQTRIIAFLDQETAKIDGLIGEQRRLMELLKEKRQSVISHAVTKGLNPHAFMKLSGIEWLNDVPSHWKVARLSYNATIENGTTPSRDNPNYWLGGDVPWLSSGEVNQYRITEATEYITNKALNECPLRLLPRGTIVIGMIGQGKTRGLSASLEIEASINQNLAAVTTGGHLVSDYLLYIFQSAYDYLREYGRGGNQAALNCEILSALRVPLPPLEEQSRICNYLEVRLEEFDTLAAEAQRAVDLLQERRSALISAAVTGQIDVRLSLEKQTA